MTIKEIAKKTGYAVSTVSRALNNHPDVSPKAKRIILEAANSNTNPVIDTNLNIRRETRKSIAIFIKEFHGNLYQNMISYMEPLFRSSNLTCEIYYLTNVDDELKLASQLQRDFRHAGFIFIGNDGNELSKRLERIAIPTVFMTVSNTDIPLKNLSYVGIDHYEAGYKACDYLLTKGHNHIGLIGGDLTDSSSSLMKLQGFSDRFSKTGEDFSKSHYASCDFTLQSSYQAMHKLLIHNEELTAVFCFSDLIALGAIRSANDLHLSVPAQISVLGFDDIETADYYIPRLTTFHQPFKQIAEKTVNSMIDMLNSNQRSTVVIPFSLIERDTVLDLTLEDAFPLHEDYPR